MSESQASMRARAEDLFRSLQNEITLALEAIDGGGTTFFRETWERAGGGGGVTMVLAEGDVFEKAGVNFSAVHGESPDSMNSTGKQLQFFATGISLVLHPRSEERRVGKEC